MAPLALCALPMVGCAVTDPSAVAAIPHVSASHRGDAPAWIKMPILTPEQKKAGIFPGGEGCQWPRDLEISEADPNFLLLTIDVGGMYRSLDGGKYWEQATVGWNARGCSAVAIDPKNADHVIGLAGNSMDWNPNWGGSPNGIYVSRDKASSWHPVLGLLEGYGNSVAIDGASFDAAKGICTVAYVASVHAGLLKSTDGGESWTKISDLPITVGQPEGGTPVWLKVSPAGGTVYLGGKAGLYVSTDGGKSFVHEREKPVFSLAVVSSLPDSLWVSGDEGLIVSRDKGKTFESLAESGVDREKDNKPVRNVVVSPADPRRMTVWVQGDNWKWVRYVSQDGGASFSPIHIVKSIDAMPYNVRNGYNVWHPKDPNILYGIGGDWVTRSTDGGKTLNWYNNGYNGVMLGGLMNFSAHDPNTIFLSFQDYNAAATHDGGATWTYFDASGKGWGGHCYGGHAVDATTFFYGDAESWGTPRRIRITHDGGKTWEFAKGPDGNPLERQGADVAFSDPVDARDLFCGNFRSTDKGMTWSKMDGCDGVFTASPVTKTLFGRFGSSVVRSKDHGATWDKVAETTGNIDDIAVDHKTGRVYAASEDKLKAWDGNAWTVIDLPADQFGAPLRCQTVATDPQAPSVVYVGGPRNIYASQATVARSTDAGKTWKNLTVTVPLKPGMESGPHEVSCVRVNPVTREAWVAGQCYGMWRIAPPAADETGQTAVLASAPKAFRPPLAEQPTPIALHNGDMEAGGDTPDSWGISWTGSGKLSLARDSAMKHGGSASLRLSSGDAPAKGQATQFIDAAPGVTFTLSGWVKSKGGAVVNVAVQPMNSGWTPLTFMQAGFVQGDSDWTHFEKTVTLPEGTARFGVVLLLDGKGTAWLDDVSLEAK